MEKLGSHGIRFWTQVVLLPGVNDEKVLEETLHTLHQMDHMINGIAVVPVGLTKHRLNLLI